MIIFHKNSTYVGYKSLNVHIFVELDDNNEDEYISGIGPSIDTDEIANMALQNSICLEDQLTYGIFGKSIKKNLKVYSDDSYDYPTIEYMINNRDIERYNAWCKSYRMLEERRGIVNYNGKSFNVYIEIFTEQDEQDI